MNFKDLFLNCTEEEYRDLHFPSYSRLSAIDQNGVSAPSQHFSVFKLGSLVDAYCFESRQYVDDKFFIRADITVPTTNVKKIIDRMIKSDQDAENGASSPLNRRRKPMKMTDDLQNHLDIARAFAKQFGVYDKYDDNKFKKVMLTGSEYFKSKVQGRGKIEITNEMSVSAMSIHQALLADNNVGRYFADKKSLPKEIEIINQAKFCVSDDDGYAYKGMLDGIVVNHKTKTIIPFDLKTGEESYSKFVKKIREFRYHIQATMYRRGVFKLIEGTPFSDYIVSDFRFVYISKNDLIPMEFVLSKEITNRCWEKGFNYAGEEYKSVKDLLDIYNYSTNFDVPYEGDEDASGVKSIEYEDFFEKSEIEISLINKQLKNLNEQNKKIQDNIVEKQE